MNVNSTLDLNDSVASEFIGSSHRHLIGGEWVEPTSGRTIAVFNPADGTQIAEIGLADKNEVDAAVGSARKALNGEWSRLDHFERATMLSRLADLVEENFDTLVAIEVADNGKALRELRDIEFAGSIYELREYAGWATKVTGDSVRVPSGDAIGYTVREPVGVAGLIVPWNFPFYAAICKLAPALAAGCTMVLKPAEQTPLSALYLGQLIVEAGFPAGVVNIVTGDGETGAALVDHPDVDKISFTGSTGVGKAIVQAASGTLKRVTLELGGKSPFIIFPDADIDRAVEYAADGIFQTSGQVCVANSRLYAHRDVFDQVIEGIADRARTIKVGGALEPGTEMGPIISEKQLDRVHSLIQSGEEEGAETVAGGKVIDRAGYFVEPTVMVKAQPKMRIMQEEIFGPVIAGSSFGDDEMDRVAAEANDSVYGLAAFVWTRDLRIAHRMAEMLKSGSVYVNDGAVAGLPAGGFKQSGWGRERGLAGLEAYTELKSVSIGY